MQQNRLAKEKSPYLLQHANNPVDWYPWCEEAFERAKKENKPVFLSIGYSTCHWCHVMEHESFEDDEVAVLMNDAFVSIKVDREERPDIDGIYMTVCQMLTGSGGWPLTIIMTPDKKPFFAGTYFPKGNRFGRAGMIEIIPQIKELWLNQRDEVLKSAEQISSALSRTTISNPQILLDEKIFERAYDDLRKAFDSRFGGFGHAPKFPTPHNLFFLLRYWKRTRLTTLRSGLLLDNEALEMVKKTLTEMRKGGIFDQIGFGFHRYSTDEKWLVPHFEKMLYDQALLTLAYVETYQVTKEEIFRRTAGEILEYVMRDMTSPEGGFYSAEDADSEGEEGKFYLWDEDELHEILGDDFLLVKKIFNTHKEGNFVDSVQGAAAGKNILHLEKSFEELSRETGIEKKELRIKIESIRKKLFDARKKRIHPYKDDKILTDWNGLMISAFAKAAQVFDEKKYTERAEKAAEFVEKNLMTKEGKLLHRFRKGEAGIPAHIDDYAFFIAALLDLYETTFDIKYLKSAIRMQKTLLEHFWDDKDGGFYFTGDEGEKLLIRQKEIYDGAVPSGNSISLLNLLRLGRFTGDSDFEKKADYLVKTFSDIVSKSASAFTQFLCGLDFALGRPKEIIITGKKYDSGTEKMLNSVKEKFIPNKILIFKEEGREDISEIAGFTRGHQMKNGKATAYICENYNCKMPVTDLSGIDELLK